MGVPAALEDIRCGTSPAECSSAEKRIRIVLALEAHEGPNAQEKAERLMTATVHLLEDVMDTFYQPGVDEEVADKIVQHPVVLQTTGATSAVCS